MKISHAQRDLLEKKLSALVDYICGYAIKHVNLEAITAAENLAILVKGGKAYSAYIETPYRDPSYDWDVSVYASTEDFDNFKPGVKLARRMQSLFDTHMMVAPLTIWAAIRQVMPNWPHAFPPRIEFRYETRVSAISNVTVHMVNLYVSGERLFSMIEMSHVPATTADDLRKILDVMRALTTCPTYSFYMVDKQRAYMSLPDIVDNLKEITAPASTYPKKDKALARLANISRAINEGHIVCYRAVGNCKDRVVYDASGTLPDYEPTRTILDAHIARDHAEATMSGQYPLGKENPNYWGIYMYSQNSSINANLIRSYYFNTTSIQDVRISDIDEAFRHWSTLPIIQYPDNAPLMLYRLVRYVDLPRDGQYDVDGESNLYDIKVGTVIPNISYTSTAYSNKHPSQAFNNETHFKGCIYIITAKSSRGLIVVDKNSYYPHEREVLLDRRGSLRVTKVSWDYVTETCGDAHIAAERMVLHCDYLPPGDEAGSALHHILSVDDRTFDAEQPETGIVSKIMSLVSSDDYRTEYLSDAPATRDRTYDRLEGEPARYRRGGVIDTCNVIYNIYKHFDDRDPGGDQAIVWTRAGKKFVPMEFLPVIRGVVPDKAITLRPGRAQVQNNPLAVAVLVQGGAVSVTYWYIVLLVLAIILIFNYINCSRSEDYIEDPCVTEKIWME
jgi:hypothetical protein